MQRILVQLFKQFFQKTTLPLVKQNYDSLKQWLYFSSIISQDFIDYSKLEKYVHSLPNLFSSTDGSNSKSSSTTKYPFQKRTSFNEEKPLDKVQDKKEEINFNKFFDDVTIPTSSSICSPLPQSLIVPKVKDPLKSLEATKQILFGLNNLHLMFVEYQYQFEFPKKESIENSGGYEPQPTYSPSTIHRAV